MSVQTWHSAPSQVSARSPPGSGTSSSRDLLSCSPAPASPAEQINKVTQVLDKKRKLLSKSSFIIHLNDLDGGHEVAQVELDRLMQEAEELLDRELHRTAA